MVKKNKKPLSFDDLQKKSGSSNRLFGVVATIAALLAVALVVVVVYTANINSNKADTVAQIEETVKAEKVVKSLSGKTPEEDRLDAVTVLQKTLVATNAPADLKEAESSVDAIANGDLSSFDKSFAENINMYDTFEADENFKLMLASGMYSFASVIKSSNNGEIPLNNELLPSVIVDHENGIAMVPLKVFTGKDSPVHFTMMYTADGWKLEPGSIMSLIQVSAGVIAQQQPAQ